MNLKYRVLLPVLVIALVLPVSAQPISYTDALQLMLSEHGDILASQSTLEQYAYEKKAAFGLRLPTVTLNAGYTHMNDDLALQTSIPLSIMPGVSVPVDYTLQNQNFFNASAGLMWPLFTGFQVTAANKAATASYDSAEADLSITKSALIHELTSKYFALELATEAAALRKEVCDSLLQHYHNTVAKEKVGMVPHVESMHAEVSLNEARRDYNQALQDTEIARAALKNLITLDLRPETAESDYLEPITSLFVLDPHSMESLGYFKNKASTRSPQSSKITAMQLLAGAGLEGKRATYMPVVYAFGDYELYKDDLTMMEPEWYIGLGVQWKIFEGLSGHNAYIAASKQEQSAAYKAAQAKRNLATLAEVCYKQMLKAYETYILAKESLGFTQEYLRVRTRAFESGFATSIDVVDAQTAVSKNRLDILSAAYAFDTALSQLLSLCGESQKFEEYRNNPNVEIIQ